MTVSTSYQPIIVLIPAKNEVNTVGKVVSEIKTRLATTVVVIDDASKDDTGKIARSAGAQVLSLPFSLGAWGAIQTGLRYAFKHGFNTAITMDADGQHEADSILALVQLIAEQQCDVVIGAHPQRGSWLRRMTWAFFRQLSGIKLTDLTSGLRAYNRTAINLLASPVATLLDYQDMGVLILLQKAGLSVRETPILMYPRTDGHSRIFSSWWAVGSYLLHTGILCLAKVKQNKKVKCHTN